MKRYLVKWNGVIFEDIGGNYRVFVTEKSIALVLILLGEALDQTLEAFAVFGGNGVPRMR